MGRVKAFYKVQTQNTDETVDLLQDSLERAISPLTNSPIVNGDLLTDVTLTTGIVNRISHKLNREPLGYIVVLQNAAASIYDQQKTNKRKDLFLDLQTSATCVVSLWVF